MRTRLTTAVSIALSIFGGIVLHYEESRPAYAQSRPNIAGKWKAVVVGGVLHKTIGQGIFDFNVDGNHLGGKAHIGNDETSYFPGAASITDGKIEGHHVSFTVIGVHLASTGVPIMKFDGTIHGDELSLVMALSYSGLSEHEDKMQFKGARISK